MSTAMKRLEGAANVAIIIAAIAVVGSWGHYYWGAPTGTGSPLPSYDLGENLADAGELKLREADLTLLVYVNSQCPACTASMPFYSRLVEAHQNSESIVRIVFASREPRAVLTEYLENHAVGPVELVSIPPDSSFRNVATPHVLLVKYDGEIVGTWVGKLASSTEEVVIDAALRTKMPRTETSGP